MEEHKLELVLKPYENVDALNVVEWAHQITQVLRQNADEKQVLVSGRSTLLREGGRP